MIDPLYSLSGFAVGLLVGIIIGSLLAGSLPGIFVGSYFAIRIPERALRLVLATTLLVVAGRIAYGHANSATSIFTAFSR